MTSATTPVSSLREPELVDWTAAPVCGGRAGVGR